MRLEIFNISFIDVNLSLTDLYLP